MRKCDHGYTLIELLITLAILGMIILLVLPLYPESVSKREIEFAIKQFEEDYFYVQQKALTESKTLRLVTNSTSSYYYVQELEENSSGGYNAKTLFTRRLPPGLSVRKETGRGNDFEIDYNGYLKKEGTLTFAYQLQGKIHRTKYIFQVHTGRFRVEHGIY